MSEHLQPIYAIWAGNAEAMAADIEELGVTVRQWRNRGDIPSRAWPKIIRAAAEKGAALRLESFLPQQIKDDLPTHDETSSEGDSSSSATNDRENIGTAGEGGHRGPFSSSPASPATTTSVDSPSPEHGRTPSSSTQQPDSETCSTCSSARAA